VRPCRPGGSNPVKIRRQSPGSRGNKSPSGARSGWPAGKLLITMSSVPPSVPDDPFLPTRSSLLSRLKNASDAVSWQAFVDNYGRLIHQVCLRTGLQRQEAEEVVQETIADVARAMPKFTYDRSRGSFKGWLARVTRNHIADFLTKKTREAARREEMPGEQMEDAAGAGAECDLTLAWESEWRQHLLDRALRRVQEIVSARNIQIFQLSAVQGWSTDEIAKSLTISRARVYLARHRVGRLVAREVESLRRELE
jgi:RNA polymerase sigma factor (sigma-70 family)